MSAQAAPAMHGYLCIFRGRRHEVRAETSLAARTLAAAHFRSKKPYEITVVLCERPDGTPVEHSPQELAP